VFTAVCVALAAAGHAITSCAAVPLWSLGVGFLAAFAVAAPLAGRERSLPGIAALLAVGQAVLHTLFGLGQHGTATTASGSVDTSLVARAARLVCGAAAATLSPAQAQRILADARLDTGGTGTGTGTGHAVHEHASAAVSTTAGSSVSVLPSLPMLLVHVLAAVATGWLLRRGDIALRRLLRLSAHGVAESVVEGALAFLRRALALVRALLAGLPGAPEAAPHAPDAMEFAPPVLRTTVLQHSVIRRGPPPGEALVLAA
jgi:hypothetical protein